MRKSEAREKLIIAIDTGDLNKFQILVDELKDFAGMFKVGIALFTAAGPQVINMIVSRGGKVFLDLKFHDIPSVVRRAVSNLVERGVSMFTLHILGGKGMLEAAVEETYRESKRLGIPRPKAVGVTILTSLDSSELSRLGIERGSRDEVFLLSQIARENGLDGVVSSPREAKGLRRLHGEGFLIVTPGIRLQERGGEDQRRVSTPRNALLQGADYLVVGRPITHASCPQEAASKILEEMEEALKDRDC